MNELRVIAITHKHFSLEEIGRFHIIPENRKETLLAIQSKFGITDLFYMSTCNRVELVFSCPNYVCPGQTQQILQALIPTLSEDFVKEVALKADRFNGVEAIEHLLRVASSLDSLVIGEREIITQLRKSFEECAEYGVTGDATRLVINQCVKTAKEIFTHTDLSKKPVSVVSLAWHKFREYGVEQNARIILVGAGQIIRNFSKFLFENDYKNIVVANRTLSNAEQLTNEFNGSAITLDELNAYKKGFDVIVSCTASDSAVISNELYTQMLNGDTKKKLVIDLAIPADIDTEVVNSNPVEYVDMNTIQSIAQENIQFRSQAINDCEAIIEVGMKDCARAFNERRIEQAMRSIPETIKEIKSTALGEVFAKDLEKLDDASKEVIEKILQYMEKKYISVPMKMAREVLLDAVKKN